MFPSPAQSEGFDLDYLLKLQLVVGRAGVADLYGCWSTHDFYGNIEESLSGCGIPPGTPLPGLMEAR